MGVLVFTGYIPLSDLSQMVEKISITFFFMDNAIYMNSTVQA